MRFFHRSSTPLARPAEWLYVACCTWFVIGLFLDGWAHNHVPELESFFTPWHAVFYTGYLLIVLMLTHIWYRSKGGFPPGYREAAIGAAIFVVGAIGDLLWHEAFGVEKDIEALFSPTHLVLALGSVLMLAAPLLRVLRTGKTPKTFIEQLPAILSITYVAAAVMFLTQFHHWSDLRLTGAMPREFTEMRQGLAMAGYLWHVTILMAASLFLVRTFPPTLGTHTALFAISTIGMGVMRMDTLTDALPIVCIAYIVGFLADLWAANLWPIDKRLGSLRGFSAGIPASLVALLHGYAIPLFGTWWSIHLWTGAVAIAAGVGVLVGLMMVPPQKE